MNSKSNDSCLHYTIQPMRGPMKTFNDFDKICLQCRRRLTEDEAEAVRREIEYLRIHAKW